jgi:hypothetical protein
LQQQGIKPEDIPSFNDHTVASFFGHLYAVYTADAHKEVLWQSARDPLKVAYSKQKPDGSYTRVATTLGRWLKRIDPSIHDSTLKALSERYKALATDTAGLTLEVCEDEMEIVFVYADSTVCKSCMTGVSAARVYDSPDIEVVYAMHEGRVVGRAVCNRETKEYVRAYPTGNNGLEWVGRTESEWRELFLSLLERKGYTHNTECLWDLRLKYIGGDGQRLFMPYIDGDYQCVSWNEGDKYAIVCDSGDDTYTCTSTNGFSEPRAYLDHDGGLLINGVWYSEDEVRYSAYNAEYLPINVACYSDFDGDYMRFDQAITVRRFAPRAEQGFRERVRNTNYTLPVEGLDFPVLVDEMSQWIQAGFIVQLNGTYYTTQHDDVVWCQDEEKYALKSDCIYYEDEVKYCTKESLT